MTRSGVAAFVCALVSSLFCLPSLIFGSWLLTLWITIQIQRCVYLAYPYLATGIGFVSLGFVALLGLLYGSRRRGYWRVLLALPVAAGLWSMIVIPNILPSDLEASGHLSHMVRALDYFSGLHNRYPANETELKQVLTLLPKERNPYRQNGRELPFRIVLKANANGPFLEERGTDPGVMFYAVSQDRQEVWLTETELGSSHPVGNHVRFVDFFSIEGDPRVFHRRANRP